MDQNQLSNDAFLINYPDMKVYKERVVHPNESFRFMHMRLDRFNGERHRHTQAELTWVSQGAGVRFVGDSAAPFEAGDLVLIGPDVPHLWVSHADDAGKVHELSVAQFPADLLQTLSVPEWGDVSELLRRAALGLVIREPVRSEVQALMLRMQSEQGLTRLGLLIEILGLLITHPTSLQTLSSASVGAAGGRDSGQTDRRIDRVVRWIQEHLAQNLCMEDAAAQVHVSPAAFSRFFRRSLGKTFTEYVNDLRCTEAAIQLRKTDKPVATVALDCGFTTLSHFNRQFLQRHGQTPRHYRKSA
jgi:AraC-like DNA-binding protein/quercetin dioxygenase-like cupin family protein